MRRESRGGDDQREIGPRIAVCAHKYSQHTQLACAPRRSRCLQTSTVAEFGLHHLRVSEGPSSLNFCKRRGGVNAVSHYASF